MSRVYRKTRNLLRASAACFALMSLVILLMPNQDSFLDQKKVVLIGISFWGAGILGTVFSVLASSSAKKQLHRERRFSQWRRQKIGLLSPVATLPGMISGVVSAVSLLIFVILSFTRFRFAFINYILLSLVLLGFALYCLFNGKTYWFIHSGKNERKRGTHHA